jgi:hypothetical protein
MSVQQLGIQPWKPVGPQCADPIQPRIRPDPIRDFLLSHVVTLSEAAQAVTRRSAAASIPG